MLIIFAFSAAILIFSNSMKLGSSLTKIQTDLTNYVEEYDSLIDEITNVLRTNNVELFLDYAILPDEKVEILIKVPSNDMAETTKDEIEQVVIRTLKENNSNPDLFLVHISSFYEKSTEVERLSTRLSYNDLIGYIKQELESKNHSTSSLDYKISSKKVELIIDLPVNSSAAVKKEAEQIARTIIEQNHYNIDDFEITIISMIQTD